MTSRFDRELFMPVPDAKLRQWFIDRFDCLHCLDSGIIFHRDGTDEPCDKCNKFEQRLEQDRAQLLEQAAATPNSNSN